MSQDKLAPQVTVYVPADRNQSAPQDTAPFVVFFHSVTGPVVLFSFYFNPRCFEALPKIITLQHLSPFFLFSVIQHLNCVSIIVIIQQYVIR